MTSEENVAVRTNGYTSLEDSSENDEQVELFDESEKTFPEYLEFKSSIKALQAEEDEQKEYGEFEGYASVFDNADLGNDVVKGGAFRKSLRKRGIRGIKLLYQHKTDMPIGVFDSIKEDAEGLYVKGRLALKSTAGRDAYELLKMGALDGMSIGFTVSPDNVSWDKRSKKRIIEEVDLMEVSLVTFPMNPLAKVRSVKGEAVTVREWETGMRDAFSLSRSEAKMAAKAVHDVFENQSGSEMLLEAKTDTELASAIRNLTLTLQNR